MIYKQVEEKVETSVNLGHDLDQSLILMEGSLFWILIEAYFPKSRLFCFDFFQCSWKMFSDRKTEQRESLYVLSQSSSPTTTYTVGTWALGSMTNSICPTDLLQLMGAELCPYFLICIFTLMDVPSTGVSEGLL